MTCKHKNGRALCPLFDSNSGIPCNEHEDEYPTGAIPPGDGYATACTLPCDCKDGGGEYEKYSALVERMLAGRDNGSITEEEDDAITEQLDDLWYEMTDEERSKANKRAGEWHTKQNSKVADLETALAAEREKTDRLWTCLEAQWTKRNREEYEGGCVCRTCRAIRCRDVEALEKAQEMSR